MEENKLEKAKIIQNPFLGSYAEQRDVRGVRDTESASKLTTVEHTERS